MKELLNKELKLVLHPTNILFIPLAFMLFIPNYPYLVIMFYTCLGVFFMCQFGRENNDVFFTMMLPVEKHKTVLARIISVSLLELLEIAVCVPIALLRAKIMTPVNAADLDVNITLFAFFFMIFGVFNIIFFPAYYKNVKRIGVPLGESYRPEIIDRVSEDFLRLKPLYLLLRQAADEGMAKLDA